MDEENGEGHLEIGRSLLGVPKAGGGKDASMSEIDPDRLLVSADDLPGSEDLLVLFSAFIMSQIPSLLAVFPLSRLAATRVALRIKSGKLVRLPLASASLTASMSRRGGRRCAGTLSLIKPDVRVSFKMLNYAASGSVGEVKGDLDHGTPTG